MDPFGAVGTHLAGKYRVDRVIGEGGFGVVYAGFHLVIGQPVAMKLMKPAGGGTDPARSAEGFLREARVLFDLAHPSIVRLYDVGTITTRLGEIPYVVLELIAGVSLAEEVRRRQRGELPPFGAAEIFGIFDALLDGLAAAHARGIAHRDLKPSNVMLTRDAAGTVGAKILDFGTARADGPMASVGPAGFTPLYAAPEQWDARFGQTGPATDIFATGLLIAETALLVSPLAGEGMAQIAGAAMDATRRPSVASFRPDLPREIDALILRATRPAPGERFADAAQMRAALRDVFAGVGSSHSAPAGYAPPGGMIRVGGPPIAATPPHGALTTSAPLHGATLNPAPAPSRAPGPHPLSIVALVVGLAALGAVVAFGVIAMVVFRRAREEPIATAPAPAGAKSAPSTTTPAASAQGAKPPKSGHITISVELANAFNPAELKRIATAHEGELSLCYASTLAHDATFRGTATVTVFNTMGAQDCSFDARKDDEADVMCACLKSTISTWSIPRPNNVWGSALFEYEIRFVP